MTPSLRSIRGPLLSPATGGLRVLRDAVVRWDVDGGRLIHVGAADASTRADGDVRGGGLIVPGFVDAHVHFPQLDVRGRFRDDLLPWLREFIWPEECRFRDPAHAAVAAPRFLGALARAGTTTAAVYGSPHPHSVAPLLEAGGAFPDVLAGPALMDRDGPDELLVPAREAEAAMRGLARRFGDRLVVTPRFAVSSTPAHLETCGRLARELGLRVQTHLSENPDEIALVARRFPGAADYLDVYDRAALVGPRTLLAHVVHPTARELDRIAEAGAAVVHCPTSNRALGSGRMPLERLVRRGIRLALGSDVGAGPDLCLLDVMRAFVEDQQGRGDTGIGAVLELATAAGARALGLADRGVLEPGKRADLVVLEAPGADDDPIGALESLVHTYRTEDHSRVRETVCGGLSVGPGRGTLDGVIPGGDGGARER